MSDINQLFTSHDSHFSRIVPSAAGFINSIFSALSTIHNTPYHHTGRNSAVFWKMVTRWQVQPLVSVFYSAGSFLSHIWVLYRVGLVPVCCIEKWSPGGQQTLEPWDRTEPVACGHDPPVLSRTPGDAMPHSVEHTMVNQGGFSLPGIP